MSVKSNVRPQEGLLASAQVGPSTEISVIIPCLNEEEAVGKVVDHRARGDPPIGPHGRGHRRRQRLDRRIGGGCGGARRDRGLGATPRLRQRVPGRSRRRAAATTSSWATPTTHIRSNELGEFVERLEHGDDLVIGSRFKGTIHGDAMPFLNRFVGNPILTGMLNVLFGVKVSDAHCGMRAVRREALPVLDLHSTGMEFASEMVFKAYRRGLTVSEVPIDYYPRVGESKLNRFGDAWRHVRFMLLYSPSWLYLGAGKHLAPPRARRHGRPRRRARSTSSATRGRSTRCSGSSR